jgi:Sec-independent protein secretion pathway component TatC
MVIKKVIYEDDEETPKEIVKRKTSRNLVIALSIVSIIGFVSIILESLFYINISEYIDTFLLVVLGLGLIFETSIGELKLIKKEGLNSEYLGKITMIVVGSLSVIAGVLSLPQINILNPSFLAVKGIISLLAIVFIILQTWVAKHEE